MNQLEGIILMSQQEKHGMTHDHSDLDILVYCMYVYTLYTLLYLYHFISTCVFIYYIILYHIIFLYHIIVYSIIFLKLYDIIYVLCKYLFIAIHIYNTLYTYTNHIRDLVFAPFCATKCCSCCHWWIFAPDPPGTRFCPPGRPRQKHIEERLQSELQPLHLEVRWHVGEFIGIFIING